MRFLDMKVATNATRVSLPEFNDFFGEVRSAVRAVEAEGTEAAWKLLILAIKERVDAFDFRPHGKEDILIVTEMCHFADMLGKVDIEADALPRLVTMVGALYDGIGGLEGCTVVNPRTHQEHMNRALKRLLERLTARL